MADKFEVMKLWMPLTLSYSSNQPKEEGSPMSVENFRTVADQSYTATVIPIDSQDTILAWEKATELSKDGWERIGSVPVIGYSYPFIPHQSRYYPRDLSHSYTTGYELLFKGQIEKTD